jgi:hypothetical protein
VDPGFKIVDLSTEVKELKHERDVLNRQLEEVSAEAARLQVRQLEEVSAEAARLQVRQLEEVSAEAARLQVRH